MKVSCPNCQKVFSAPPEWAGRKVKCPGCKGPVTLPRTDAGGADDLSFDLGSLETFEAGGEVIVRERKGKPMTLKEAQAVNAAAAAEVAATQQEVIKIDPTMRICPGCGEKVHSTEPYGDLICRHCGATIPGRELDAREKNIRYSRMSDRIANPVTFYTGFTSAALYPLPALGAIGLGMVIALAAIAVPILPIVAFTGASGANEISKTKMDFGWVGTALSLMFVLEAIYYGAVAYYAMIDTIRTTTSGTEQPPPLTWAPVKLVSALGGYAALIGFYLAVILALFTAKKGTLPSSAEDLELLSDPASLIVLALLTFSIPMNLIGLSSSQAMDGLNPLKFGKSIGKSLGHYIFLFLIFVLYLGFYVGVMYAVMSWAAPTITQAATKDTNAGMGKIVFNVLAGLGAWSILIGAALYFAYALGRILGLFSRTYRERMAFEL